jgi:hypothetical protein
MKPVYEWKWRRTNSKHFLVLLKDGKKLGSALDLHPPPQQCECGPDYNCLGLTLAQWDSEYPNRFTAYVGGKRLDEYEDMTAAKVAVETALGVTTKKEKKVQVPEKVKSAREVELEIRMQEWYGSRWRDYTHNPHKWLKSPRRQASVRTQRRRVEREEAKKLAKQSARLGII